MSIAVKKIRVKDRLKIVALILLALVPLLITETRFAESLDSTLYQHVLTVRGQQQPIPSGATFVRIEDATFNELQASLRLPLPLTALSSLIARIGEKAPHDSKLILDPLLFDDVRDEALIKGAPVVDAAQTITKLQELLPQELVFGARIPAEVRRRPVYLFSDLRVISEIQNVANKTNGSVSWYDTNHMRFDLPSLPTRTLINFYGSKEPVNTLVAADLFKAATTNVNRDALNSKILILGFGTENHRRTGIDESILTAASHNPSMYSAQILGTLLNNAATNSAVGIPNKAFTRFLFFILVLTCGLVSVFAQPMRAIVLCGFLIGSFTIALYFTLTAHALWIPGIGITLSWIGCVITTISLVRLRAAILLSRMIERDHEITLRDT